jgi:lycopene cyclase CruP
VLSLGDAGGGHSPLSFGGFGSLVRHLPRLATAVDEALREERLSRRDLAWVQPYLPSLSAAFLLQRAMAPRPGQVAAPDHAQQVQAQPQQQAAQRAGEGEGREEGAARRRGWLPPDHVNRLLRCNFGVLRALGPAALRPFLQDTLRFAPLAATMAGMMLR